MLQKLKGLIASGNPREAINIMVNVLADIDREKYNEIILLSGRVTRNQSLFAQDLIDLEDYRQSEAKTNHALIAILDSIPADSFSKKKQTQSSLKVEATNKTKLLFIASQPSDKPLLKLEKEYLEIRKIFKKYRHLYSITEEFDATIDSFFDAIKEQNPHIIHFSGYGNNESVALSRNMDRTTHLVSYEYLAPSFKLIGSNTECVFFNTQDSCLFAKVISRFIPFAIGISGVVTDEDAISFSSGFYSSLAIEKNYEKAFQFGKELFLSSKKDKQNPLLEQAAAPINAEDDDDDVDFERFTGEDACSDCNYYLYINGYCKEDTTTPEDFYMPGKNNCQSSKH